MSYDLAVWEGELAQDNAGASGCFERLLDQTQCHPDQPPTPRIRAFLEALVECWPQSTDGPGDETPWPHCPLINNAVGPIVYFAMMYSRADEATLFAAQVAKDHGLVCYDPQHKRLRP